MCVPYRIEISSPYYYNCSLCNVYFEKYIEYTGCNHKFCKSCKKKYNIKYRIKNCDYCMFIIINKNNCIYT